MQFLKKYKITFVYGAVLAMLFVLLKLIEYRLLLIDYSIDIYAGSIALLFLLVGIWLSQKISSPKKEIRIIEKEKIVEKEVFISQPSSFVVNQKALEDTNLSARELDVLQLIAKGLSNAEIAAELCVSINTIKTHVTNLFYKLEVTRRTQAVEKAKQLSLIP